MPTDPAGWLMRAPVVLAGLMLLVLAYGLSATLLKNLEVAPWAADGRQGRLHFHSKNVTRLAGSAEQVGRSVQRAVFLEESGALTVSGDWRETLRTLRGRDEFHFLKLIPTPTAPTSSSPAPSARYTVVLPADGDDAARWALPGAYWAAYAQAPVILAGAQGIQSEQSVTTDAGGTIYVLAPEWLIPDSVIDQLRAQGPVVRVAGDDLASHAVRIAEYRDEATGFGWGRTHARRTGYFEFVIAAPLDAAAGWAALPLAQSNAATWLFAGDDGGLPATVDRYIWTQRADWVTTPSEGPFRHFWIVGDRVSYAAQARLDLAPEKAPYLSMGVPALGPMEGLLIVYILLGIAGAIFVALHGMRLLPDVMASQRIAWVFTALLLPVVGVVLYLAAYRRPRMAHGRMVHWVCPAGIQAAAATAMGFGYGAPFMIVIGFAFAYLGFPLFFGAWADGWPFVFGAGMPLMMAGMFVGAVLLAWPLVQTPMAAMMQAARPRDVALRTLGVTTLSMAAVSLGMMSTAWWMMMAHLPMMPKEDEILWFGAMWLASSVGFLLAWPLNLPMVRTHLKTGAM